MTCPKCDEPTVLRGGPVTGGGVDYCPACGAEIGRAQWRSWRHRQADKALACLGLNLAIGGALCAAFDEGRDQEQDWQLYHEHGYRLDGMWRPGCGRPSPFWRMSASPPRAG